MSDHQNFLTCPKCQAPVRASQAMAGSRVRCPQCSNTFKLPGVVASTNDDDDWFNLSEPLDKSKPKPKPKPVTAQPASAAGEPKHKSGDESTADWLDDVPAMTPVIPRANNTLDDLGFPDLDEADLDALQLPPSNKHAQGTSLTPDEMLGFDDVVADVQPATVESEYRFPCPICESAHYAKPSAAGKKIKCTDCTSTITIPPPPKVVPKYHPPIETAATFGLKESVRRPNSQDSPFTKSAADLLRDAEDTQLDEDLDNMYENPDIAGWFREILVIFADPGVVMHFVFVSVLCSVALAAMTLFKDAEQIALVAVGTAVGAACGTMLCACCLSIMQSASDGQERVNRWPTSNPGDALSGAILAFVACVVASIPGQVLGMMIGEPFTLLWGVFVMLSIWGLLPIILLSMLEKGSVFSPYSKEVIKSFDQCMEPWGGMYFSSGLFFFAYFMLLVAPPSGGIVKAVLTATGLVGLAFVYARMLGKLAFAIGQAVEASKPKKRQST